MSEKKMHDDAAPRTIRTIIVEWTSAGEAAGAYSEHGKHKAGELVETEHADALIKAGYAKAAE